jgi:hypothetical protein
MIKLTSINLIVLSIIILFSSNLNSKVSFFSEKGIEAEYQIFNFNERVILDSLELEYFNYGKDTILLNLYKQNNFYFNKSNPQVVYTDTIFNINASKNRIHLDFTKLNLEIIRQELILEFVSKNDNSRLITDDEADTLDCGGIIFGRNQKFTKENKIINGNSNYKVKIYFRQEDDISDLNYEINKKKIDSALKFNDYSNFTLVDLNKDDYLDLFIENSVLLNDKNGSLVENNRINLGESIGSLNQVYDLNDDGILELIRFKLDGKMSIYSVSSDLELINEIHSSFNSNKNEIIKILFLDIDKDNKTEIFLVSKNKIEILKNNYPIFESEYINFNEEISDADINLNKNCIVVYSKDKLFDSELIEVDDIYFSKKNINPKKISVSYLNNDSLYQDKIEVSDNYNSFNLFRSIFKPMYVYTTNLENDFNDELIIISSNKCQTNTIISFNNKETIDLTEFSNLKFLNLRNVVFADINNNGYKEIIQLQDSTIAILEMNNKAAISNSNITTNKNINRITINDNESYIVHSSMEYGLNQVYGQVELNNTYFNEGDIVQLNSEKYLYNENRFKVLDEELSTSMNELIFKVSQNKGELEFFLKNDKIGSIQIINSIGQEIYINNNVNKRLFSLNINDFNQNLVQTVYYYIINTFNKKEVYKGQFTWIK